MLKATSWKQLVETTGKIYCPCDMRSNCCFQLVASTCWWCGRGLKPDTHYPYIRAVYTVRIYGCPKWHPYIPPVYMGALFCTFFWLL